ncbi:glycoside hydrolase family protein [Piscirickettsia litoralis]|uniref:Lysozyme n=1 Tax=Piscirickettsia litoralis TaxID=1891921 RepID=A0ABX3A0C0_9GAMM|nr:glycoside hydrolase family protein [Piscirickettsia litoralis]ODN41151.1 hypothetical protein BGC07_17915 [Piscirickettsia litoralis]
MNKQELIDSLKESEGVRFKPYRDTVGKLTIGVGRNLDDLGISDDEANYLLNNDIERVLDQCTSLPYWLSLNDERKAVIAEMLFNLGLSGVKKFKNMSAALKENNFDKAAAEMLNSKWANQVGNRAVRLANRMKLGC